MWFLKDIKQPVSRKAHARLLKEENVSFRWIPHREKHGQDYVFARGTHKRGGRTDSLITGPIRKDYPDHPLQRTRQ